jgi:hypothetical protein
MAFNNSINNKIGVASPNGYTFPAADGTAYTCMQSNAAGTLSWGSSIITPWIAFTPTITATVTNPTLGTNTQANYYMQIGKMLFVQIFINQTTIGTGGSGTYLFSTPSGFTINTTVCQVSNTGYRGTAIGYCWLSRLGIGSGCGPCYAYDSTHFTMSIGYGASTNGGVILVASNNFSLASSSQQEYGMHLRIPVN